MRRTVLILSCLLALLAVWLLWPSGNRRAVFNKSATTQMVVVRSASSTRVFLAGSTVTNGILVKTNRFAYRLNNTAKSIGQLATDGHAILLDNALVDTTAKMDLKIPAHLRAGAQPGAYIVQARGAVDASFRAALAGAGAQIVSYIPNNAYLVQLSAAGAGVLEGNALVQAVLPFEPYFKLQASLLGLAVQQKALPPQQVLTLGLFDNGAAATLAQIQKLGGIVLATDRSPFGPIVRVRPSADWIALAQLPGVQRVEPTHRRITANDLSRVTTGVAVDTITNANWLGLSGSNVLVEVNDTGIDATHPDFTATGSALTGPAGLTRVTGDTNDSPNSLMDTDGHGTHVAGIIAGNGSMSINPTNVGAAIASYNEGSVTNADFRGKAPLASLYSFGFLGANDTNIFYSDALLQEIPALTNALISNNSWVNDGANEYDLSAASYDAAVRDALPEVTGSQPVLFVFAAGNDGAGNNGGGGGNPDSISSPGTAKNVITVGALEQLRNITNTYTPLGSTNQVAAWLPGTDSSSQVAWYSARGNVGIGTEGTYGRYKPDVVAPGTFVASTRSSQWDQAAYYNVTNYYENSALSQTVDTNGLNYYSFSDFGFVVKPNAVSVSLQILDSSPVETNMPFYVSLNNFPDPATPSTYDFVTRKNGVTIPSDGGSGYLASIIGNAGNFNFGVGDPTNVPVTYDMSVQMITTNDLGNYFTVLSNLNQTIGPYYRYETGTSMAAADVSGVLALMQDFFTNTLHVTPSPALLKAMLINGSRPTGFYNFQVNNNINFQGWGLINLPDSIPLGITNTTAGINQSEFFIDQSPTNALATGDSRTYKILLSSGAQNLPLRLTLAWTDQPGNPVAAIKLVNNLDLIVTNTDNPTNPIVYYGNDIAANQVFNTQENSTNASVVLDTVNNVKNVFLPAFAGTNFTVVIYGTAVNVNAVNPQTNNPTGGYAPNIVQDFAFVMSSGNGSNTNGFSITSATLASNPTGDQRITAVVSTNSPLMNQMVGAASPVMATNYLAFVTNSTFANNAQLTIGQTNQWHFYIVTNNGPSADYTNAAFVTFLPATLSLPREGVFAGTDANSTRPEADIDLFVASSSTAAGLMNLDPIVISNCLSGSAIGQTSNNLFYAASLSRGGTEVIVDSNSTPGQVYYIGVKSEDQTAAEYDFLPEFSSTPFSQMTTNGEVVQMFPVDIPDGNATLPGYTNTIGLAIYPIDTRRVIVTNILAQQNVGDLVISLDHSSVSGGNGQVVLMNHDSPNAPGIYKNIYDDSGQGDVVGSQPSDGPGSLQNFARHSGQGVWIMHAADNAPGFVGNVQGTLLVQPHQDLKNGIQVTIQPGTWFYDYIEVPVGYTNLLVAATNITLPPSISQPVQLYLNYNTQPTFSNYLAEVDLTNGIPPGNSISYGPPLTPGTYYVGLFNSSLFAQTVYIIDTLSFNSSAISTVDYASTGPVPLKDDAVTYAYITNFDRADTIQNFNVGLRVDHQRISDLSFTLVSPDGTRYLLMENRGGQSTNGCGATVITTNITPVSSSGGSTAVTNFIPVGLTSGSVNISYNMFTVPDQMAVYYSTNPTPANLITNFFTSGAGQLTVSFPPTGVLANSTYLTVVMNATNRQNRTFWTYTVGGVQTNYYYFAFTEDTNLTTTPIKYAVPPFVPNTVSGILWTDNFDAYPASTYTTNPAPAFGNWTVLTNQLEIINTNPPAYSPSNALSLDNGAVSIPLPTVAGQKYLLQYEQGSSGSDDTNSPSTNANWQVVSYVFTAAQNNQLLLLDATGDTTFSSRFNNAVVRTFVTNTVLDDFQLTTVPSNLYNQPEQDISGLNGTSAYGLWTLEVLDNRAGATNNAVLDSWSLGFTFANTNFTIPTITVTNGGGPISNSLPGGAIAWYLITVPTNADFATNSLIFATLPLNLWFSTNVPPTTTNSGDVLLLGNSTGGSVVLGTNGSPINSTTAYIIPGGSYYLGVQNSNVTTANYAIDVTFHLLPAAPLLYTLPATSVTDVSASLNAVAIPNGLPTTVYFGYGSTTNYTFFSASTIITNNLTVSNLVTAGVSNLSPGAIYHFQAIGTNALGTNFGGDLTFTNLANTPYVQTQPATNITATTATLDAIVNPGGAATTLYFQYGLTTNSLTNFSTTLTLTNNLNTTNYFGLGVTNLTPGSVYYFQAIATNSSGTNYGGILSFTNPLAGPLPYAFTAPATLATGPSAQLNGFATPNGSAATAWFQWGTSAGYGVTTPPVAIGTNYNVVFVTNQISGLTTNLPYHFRLVVSNAVGVTYGFDQIFDQANVVAWGANFFGQTLPLPSNLTNLVVGIGAGYDFSLAVNNDGTVAVWGDNTFGQTNVPAGLNNAVAVSGGEKDSLALRSDGTVLVWGSNQFRQTNVPPTLTNAVAASSGGYHCVALRADGNLIAWGFNSSGQTNIPSGLSNVVSVAGGDLHSLALKNDGTVVAWGFNDDGETNVPVGLTNVVAIAAGEYHNLALKSDGTVVAWGDNSGGQTNVPSSATNIIAIAGGGFHSLALKSDGTVIQWGDNTSGQLNNYPTNLNNVVAIAGGGFHSLALSSIYGLNQTNTAPFWTNGLAGTTLTMNELTTLLVTNTATDTNVPAQILTYTLLTNAPAWANINSSSGIITFTPQEVDGPGSNVVTTVVTDNGRPSLSATNSFILIVNEVNTPPYWPTNVPSQTNYIVNELTLLTVTNTASDSDIPTNALSYTLSVSGGVTNAAISPNGIITWVPSEAHGPGFYTFTTIVTDTNPWAVNAKSLSATNTFTVTVLESNSPPFWTNSFPTVTMNELTSNTVNAAAQDSDIPTNTLTYALTNSPAWAVINTNSGVITLTPLEADGPSTNTVTLIVTDNGVPQLSATTNFTVVVNEVNLAPYWPTNVPSQTNYVIGVSNLLTVTNMASDSDIPANLLTYTLSVSGGVTNAQISTNGIITWTPTLAQSSNTYTFTTVVTDTNPWALFNQSLSATNYFTVTVTNAPALPTNAITIASIIATNGGFLLTWFAPSNDLFQVQFTDALVPANWITFTNPPIISYNTNFAASVTNAQFNFFDDGSQSPFGPTRFYRLLLLQNTNTLTLPALSNQVVSVSTSFTVTNAATDSATNAVLTYSLLNPPVGASINPSNGIITWPNATPPGLAARFITIVTDNGLPPLTASNAFTVFVSPFPAITNLTVTATNVALQWFAPTNDQFQVQWTTNLAAPVVWTPFPGTITSTSGVFGFVDTNLPMVMKFYELILLP